MLRLRYYYFVIVYKEFRCSTNISIYCIAVYFKYTMIFYPKIIKVKTTEKNKDKIKIKWTGLVPQHTELCLVDHI